MNMVTQINCPKGDYHATELNDMTSPQKLGQIQVISRIGDVTVPKDFLCSTAKTPTKNRWAKFSPKVSPPFPEDLGMAIDINNKHWATMPGCRA